MKSKNKYVVRLKKFVWNTIYAISSLQFLFKPRKKLLVYLGMNRGSNFDKIYWKYEHCIGIEADPELFNYLKHKYRHQKNITLVHGAATDFDGTIEFNISNNDGVSSSIGVFNSSTSDHIQIVKTITVPAFNLFEYLRKNNIEQIDDYISDIQGNDLRVLKTLKPYIENKKIKTITSEVTKNKYGNVYMNLADNSEDGFNELLGKHYRLVAKGWGVLKENVFKEVPEEWWEMDCMWKAKD
jgi:FkbM family methyltransferase